MDSALTTPLPVVLAVVQERCCDPDENAREIQWCWSENTRVACDCRRFAEAAFKAVPR